MSWENDIYGIKNKFSILLMILLYGYHLLHKQYLLILVSVQWKFKIGELKVLLKFVFTV